jgi:hypothetical protein
MKTVKVEVFKPYKETVGRHSVADSDISVKELTEQVHQFVVEQIPTIESVHPTATEIRWEYEELAQGHYIMKMNGQWIIIN